MITTEYIQTMARYNRWQNSNHLECAEGLDVDELMKDRGAFFGSLFGTMNHLLWGDKMWMGRFNDHPKPNVKSIRQSVNECADWESFCAERHEMDQSIIDWSQTVSADYITGDLTWFSAAANKEVSKPLGFLITHFFNHQTHHRGQIHGMLTSAGAKPTDSDLFFLPSDA